MKKEEIIEQLNKMTEEKQNELDEETVGCPKCGRIERWGFLREWGNCNECVAEEMDKRKPKVAEK